jgi:hypothetical protein
MPQKGKPKPNDPEQSKRFIEGGREAEIDDDPKAFERAFRGVVSKRKERKHTVTSSSRRGQP